MLFWALQSSRAVHLGVDNLGVVRHVGRLLVGCRCTKPFELVNDSDLLILIDRENASISRESGHGLGFLRLRVMLMMAWFFMVRFVGEDKLGNDAADEAADSWTSEGQSCCH